MPGDERVYHRPDIPGYIARDANFPSIVAFVPKECYLTPPSIFNPVFPAREHEALVVKYRAAEEPVAPVSKNKYFSAAYPPALNI